jgi:hypothetical protein
MVMHLESPAPLGDAFGVRVGSTEPYASSRQHLLAELARIDVLVQAEIARVRRARDAAQPGDAPVVGLDAVELAREIEQRRRLSVADGIALRLDTLALHFGLSAFDLDVLLIGLLPEVDLRYEQLFAYWHDDPTRPRPSLDFALSLLCSGLDERLDARERLRGGAPLMHHALIHLVADRPDQLLPLNSRSVKVDDRIVDYLLHDADALPQVLSPYARIVEPAIEVAELILPAALRARLAAWIQHRSAASGDILYLRGAYGVGKKAIAEAACRALGLRLIVVDSRALLSAPEEQRRILCRLALREARLIGGAIYWQEFDAFLGEERAVERRWLLRALGDDGGVEFLSGEAAWEPVGDVDAGRATCLDVPLPSADDQARLWRAALARDERAPDVDAAVLVSRYRLTGGQIRDAATAARNQARLRDPVRPVVALADLVGACRGQSQPRLGAMARKVETALGWDDLVLPPDRLDRLRDACNHARHRNQVFDTWGFRRTLPTGKGLTLLFSGAPGTGKTLAASVLANELGLDLYQIDLSAVVSKYIGETEKQLARIFSEAESSRAILFFDEADALFGKRTEVHDAHDRYANIETSYLLQRFDSYEGVVILATNLSRNMDSAFTRRLQFLIEFALPDQSERLRIWQRVLPPELPRDGSVDLEVLAQRFDIAGGHIRNIALAASFFAAAEQRPLAQRHLLRAARREFQKIGKIVNEASFR